jgi:hypothetical protein
MTLFDACQRQAKPAQTREEQECKHAKQQTTTQRMFCLSFVAVPSFAKGLLRLLLSTSPTEPCGRQLCGAPLPCAIVAILDSWHNKF